MDPLTVAATLKSIRTIGRYVLKAAIEAGLEDQAVGEAREVGVGYRTSTKPG